jgi:hypothetical protein
MMGALYDADGVRALWHPDIGLLPAGGVPDDDLTELVGDGWLELRGILPIPATDELARLRNEIDRLRLERWAFSQSN